MIGCDLHDKTMLLKIAEGREEPEMRSIKNTEAGRRAMIHELKKRAVAASGARIVFAYEASGQGFGLDDELTEAGVEQYWTRPFVSWARRPSRSLVCLQRFDKMISMLLR